MLAGVLSLLAAEPSIVVDHAKFRASMALISAQYGHDIIPNDTVLQREEFGIATGAEPTATNPAVWLIRYWRHGGLLFFLLGAAGLIALPFLDRRAGLVILAFPILYAALVTRQPYIVVRSYVPLVPFWAIGFGAAVFVAMKITSTQRRKGATMLLVGVIAGLALLGPLRHTFAIAGQFAATDPLQAAYAWCDANIPPGSKILCETPWGRQLLPLREDKFRVTRRNDSIFSTPYVNLLGFDYVVTQTTGLYDSFPWARPILTGNNDAMDACMAENRRLAEQRLVMARRITPEELKYKGPGEYHVNHNVYIYKAPRVQTLSVPLKPVAGDPKTLQFGLDLPPGLYDVFIRTISDPGIPNFTFKLDPEAPVQIDLTSCPGQFRFVRTFESKSGGRVSGNITIPAAPHVARVFKEMLFVPVLKSD